MMKPISAALAAASALVLDFGIVAPRGNRGGISPVVSIDRFRLTD